MAHVAAAATAYTLEPLNLNLVDSTPNLFDGAVCEVHDCAKVPAPASLDLSHVDGAFGENGSEPTSRRRDTAVSAPPATVSPGHTPSRSRPGSTAASSRTTTAPKRVRD